MSDRRTHRLGDICSITKGKSAISRTVPGPYALVTTGAEHKTSDSYQFDGEAVCIPLVSSTGHGHASLKRVHYISGQFALANILAAVEVRDSNSLSTKYLYRYLMYMKERLLVPLMTGAANMTLSVERLASIEIPVLPLAEQKRIVRLLDEADGIRELRARADQRTADLIPALFHDMFGDPDINPMGWPVKRLGDVVKLVSGGTPSRSNASFWDGSVPWVSPKDMKSVEINDSQEHVNASALASTSLKLIPASTVLLVVRGMILAHTVPIGITRVPVTINQDMKALLPSQPVNPTFLAWSLIAQHPKLLSVVSTAGHGTKRLDSETLEDVSILFPPIDLQYDFAEKTKSIRSLAAQQAESCITGDATFEAILQQAIA